MKPKKSKPAAKELLQGSFDKVAKHLGIRREALQMAREAGSDAFHESGRVNVRKLKLFLEANPEIIEATKDLPDAKLEKALKMRAERQLAQLRIAEAVGRVVDVKLLEPRFMGLGKMFARKLMQIPDRCCQHYSLLINSHLPPDKQVDILEIKEHLHKECVNALKVISEFDMVAFLKELNKHAGQ